MTKAGAFLFEVVSIGSTLPALPAFSHFFLRCPIKQTIIVLQLFLEKQEHYRQVYHVNK